MPDYSLSDVAWSSAPYTTSPIRAVVVFIHGLTHWTVRNTIEYQELQLAEQGVLNLFPYLGPWTWMNRQSRAFLDDYLDRVYAHHNLNPNTIPLILSGGSMGGTACLIHARYTRHKVHAVASVMPCADLFEHYAAFLDVRASIHCAFRGYPESLDACLAEHSPLHQVDHLPDVPYYLYHGTADTRLRIQNHSDPLYEKMRARNLTVEYLRAENIEHEEPPPQRRHRVKFIQRVLNLPT